MNALWKVTLKNIARARASKSYFHFFCPHIPQCPKPSCAAINILKHLRLCTAQCAGPTLRGRAEQFFMTPNKKVNCDALKSFLISNCIIIEIAEVDSSPKFKTAWRNYQEWTSPHRIGNFLQLTWSVLQQGWHIRNESPIVLWTLTLLAKSEEALQCAVMVMLSLLFLVITALLVWNFIKVQKNRYWRQRGEMVKSETWRRCWWCCNFIDFHPHTILDSLSKQLHDIVEMHHETCFDWLIDQTYFITSFLPILLSLYRLHENWTKM